MREKYLKVSAILNSPNNANSWGMYPTRRPGTPQLGVPGSCPKTVTLPEFNLSFPTMHLSSVVFPQPDGPIKMNVLRYRKRKILKCNT